MTKPSSDDASVTPPLGFGDQETALRLRDSLRTLVSQKLNDERPKPRKYIVSSIQIGNRQVTAYLPGDDAKTQSLVFPFYTDYPPSIGDVVLVEGPTSGGYVTQIISRNRGVFLPSLTELPIREQLTIRFDCSPFTLTTTSSGGPFLCWKDFIYLGETGSNMFAYSAMQIPQPVPGGQGTGTPVVLHDTSSGADVPTLIYPFKAMSQINAQTVAAAFATLSAYTAVDLVYGSLYYEITYGNFDKGSVTTGTWHFVGQDLNRFDVPSHWIFIASSATYTGAIKLGSGATLGLNQKIPLNTIGYQNYSNFDSQWDECTFEVDNSGYVCLSGLIRNYNGTYALPSTLATMPAGFRPKASKLFTVMSSGRASRIDITSAGSVNWVDRADGNANSNPGDFISLEGIRYKPFR